MFPLSPISPFLGENFPFQSYKFPDSSFGRYGIQIIDKHKVKRFKNPLKVANGRASSSTTPAAQALPDVSAIPSQAHEEQAPILLQEE
ncbi:hypothetical protein H5410_003852 [Solanum commersonii]|uniref:Uncharacterized protein n=1 Tax=Solanum commersonii TaxID=4109 RepID=A0A9J6B6U1_SOLCO|nr:hypothetical protein H5410_003852 [Solanum commersonii]